MNWHYSVGGQSTGPVAQAEFEQLVRDGVIKPDTLVWRQGMANWQPHVSVAGNLAAGTGAGDAADDGTEVCAVSGRRYPRREMIQFEGSWISAEHRDAFFQRMREGVSQPGRFVYGNFWPRFAAKLIDGLILTAASIIVNMILAAFLLGSANYFDPQASPENITPILVFQGMSFLANTLIALSFGVFFIRRFSATPGKMALGLKLVRTDGSPLGVGRIIGRYFAEWLSSMILMIGYIMAAFDDQRRALHDRVCDTRVIKAK